MRSPRHLWSGDWRADSARAQEEARRRAAAAKGPEPDEPAPPAAPARSRRPRGVARLAAVALAAALALGGVFLAGTMLGGGDQAPTLPAVSSAPIRPHAGQTRAGAVYAAASPAVVSVRTSAGSGTGFLIDRDGTLVTNAHVVESSRHVLVRFGDNGASIDADVLGTDPSSDLAALSIDSAAIPRGVTPLRFADSRGVHVGDTAIAIGNPFGLDRTATEGIVSGLGRHIQAPNGFDIDQVIQTDAPINPGNSGGPLLDDGARVIGVTSQIATAGSGGNVGVGFAVPSNTVRQVIPRLRRGETIQRPYLGVETAPASPTNPSGAQVQSVVAGGPADRAGLQPGDVITRIDGKPVDDPSDIAAAVASKHQGDRVALEIDRNGTRQTVQATLGRRPAHTP
jgi:putative serine protease PepD